MTLRVTFDLLLIFRKLIASLIVQQPQCLVKTWVSAIFIAAAPDIHLEEVIFWMDRILNTSYQRQIIQIYYHHMACL